MQWTDDEKLGFEDVMGFWRFSDTELRHWGRTMQAYPCAKVLEVLRRIYNEQDVPRKPTIARVLGDIRQSTGLSGRQDSERAVALRRWQDLASAGRRFRMSPHGREWEYWVIQEGLWRGEPGFTLSDTSQGLRSTRFWALSQLPTTTLKMAVDAALREGGYPRPEETEGVSAADALRPAQQKTVEEYLRPEEDVWL